jgi:hypothetical protein
MRKFIPVILLFCCPLALALPAGSTPVSPAETASSHQETLPKKIQSLKVKDLQKQLGRKLTLKEKITFWVLKNKLKKSSGDKQSQGQIALIFGIIGAGLLVLSLVVPYIIFGSLAAAIVAIVLGSVAYKNDPSDRKAFAAKLLGWITLAAIAFLFILAAIIVASWF